MRSLMMAMIDDPYLAIQQFDYYQNYKDEIDQMLILISGEQKFIINFIAELWDNQKNEITISYKNIRHGDAFNELYTEVKGDILITMDEDHFIYQKGVLDKYCGFIGEYDVVGGKNGQYIYPAFSIWNKAKLDSINPDFADFHEGEEYIDVMCDISRKFLKQYKFKEIPVDNLPEYEHLGRSNALPLALQVYSDKPQFNKAVYKAFSRRNRANRFKQIFNDNRHRFPYPEYNSYYEKAINSL